MLVKHYAPHQHWTWSAGCTGASKRMQHVMNGHILQQGTLLPRATSCRIISTTAVVFPVPAKHGNALVHALPLGESLCSRSRWSSLVTELYLERTQDSAVHSVRHDCQAVQTEMQPRARRPGLRRHLGARAPVRRPWRPARGQPRRAGGVQAGVARRPRRRRVQEARLRGAEEHAQQRRGRAARGGCAAERGQRLAQAAVRHLRGASSPMRAGPVLPWEPHRRRVPVQHARQRHAPRRLPQRCGLRTRPDMRGAPRWPSRRPAASSPGDGGVFLHFRVTTLGSLTPGIDTPPPDDGAPRWPACPRAEGSPCRARAPPPARP